MDNPEWLDNPELKCFVFALMFIKIFTLADALLCRNIFRMIYCGVDVSKNLREENHSTAIPAVIRFFQTNKQLIM